MNNLRSELVSVAKQWELRFGVAPQITSAISEYDAAALVGMSEYEYSNAMQGASAVQRGHDFVFNGIKYQVKATRASGKPGSKVTKVPQATNYEWDVLIWIRYDPGYTIQEAWSWEVAAYREAFERAKRISPEHMRNGTPLVKCEKP